MTSHPNTLTDVYLTSVSVVGLPSWVHDSILHPNFVIPNNGITKIVEQVAVYWKRMKFE